MADDFLRALLIVLGITIGALIGCILVVAVVATARFVAGGCP